MVVNMGFFVGLIEIGNKKGLGICQALKRINLPSP